MDASVVEPIAQWLGRSCPSDVLAREGCGSGMTALYPCHLHPL